VWAKPYERTPYSIVYLHGNGASQEEGDPVHEALAHQYGCNLFLARLADHGLNVEEPMLDIDAGAWMQSALDAIAVGKAIGDSVVVLSCSTGSTLALYLASRFPGLTAGQIMLSPNIDLYDPRSFLLVSPWGLQLSRLTLGGKYYSWPAPNRAQDYWYSRYRIEGLVTLKSMLDATMTISTFKNVTDPVCMAYYFQDDVHQDKIVSVSDMHKMFAHISTPLELKQEIVLKDAGTHIIGSDLFNDRLETLWEPLTRYCEEILHWTPVDTIGWKPFLDTRS
jgi:pimeloyl-ACP methyl ester carboxylesterase